MKELKIIFIIYGISSKHIFQSKNKKRKKRMIKIKGDVIFKSYTFFLFLYY